MAVKPEKFLFLPFLAKNHESPPYKNAKIGQKINFPYVIVSTRSKLHKTVFLLAIRLDLDKLRLKNRIKLTSYSYSRLKIRG